MLSDERAAFEEWCFANGLMAESHGVRSESRACDVAWLAWQARAAVKDAVGGEPVAWMYTDRFGTHFTEEKDEWYSAEGIESVQPLYTRPQASALYQHLLDLLGAKDHEDAARIIAGHHARELSQASAAVPDLSASFMTAESGGGEYKIVLRFQTLANMQDAHSAMVHWLAASAAVPACEWSPDGDDQEMPDTWDGSCGARWTFTEGGPAENTMNFCPQCGGRVHVAASQPEVSE